MKSRILFLTIWAVLLSIPTSTYTQVLKVGEEVLIQYESPHPYVSSNQSPEIVWTPEISYTEKTATYIAVHFSEFELAEGDKLIIRSPDNARRWEYTSKDNKWGQLWSIPIYGDKAIIEIESRLGNNAFGYSIDKIARGYTQEERNVVNHIIDCPNPDDTENEICYQDDEEVHNHSKAVARLFVDGTNKCTGWLIGDEGHLMTCAHCIGDGSFFLQKRQMLL